MARYFGSPWPSGVCANGEQAPTPIGEKCWWCETAIQHDDRGYWTPVGRTVAGAMTWFDEPGHRECFLRSRTGGLAHLEQRCSCYGGTDVEAPETPVARRAEALEVWRRWTEGMLVAE